MYLQVAVVTVAFPATPLLLSRARICISASHTREDLEQALQVISEVCDMCHLKYFPVGITEKEKALLTEKEKSL
jgi:serine palmitoyltransferase